ncbi:DUF11 domain-containing protein [bacterium]|nr:DUF11 domain-containing protein [bacterium]
MSPNLFRFAALRHSNNKSLWRSSLAAFAVIAASAVTMAQNAVPVPPLPTPDDAAESTAVPAVPAAGVAPQPLPPSAPKPPHIVVPQDIQVVSIQTPDGVGKSIVGPDPAFKFAASDSPDGHLLAGLRVGSTSIVQFPEPQGRTGKNIYASIELYGHLHRPSDIDPLRFPLRVTLSDDDIEAVLDQGRLITRVIYLEDPRQAIPYLSQPDRLPTTELGPGEDPFRIARALGRIMAVVRIGTREPTQEEVAMLGASRLPLTGVRCLYVSRTGEGCRMSCPTVTCAPAPVAPSCKPPQQPGMPMDEYLCDGGDDGRLATATQGSSMGIEPQDAVVQFGIGMGPGSRRMLPTNIVCIYAPRFAATEIRTGANENILVQGPVIKRNAQLMEALRNRELGVKLTRIDPPVTNRMTQRASGIINRQAADAKIELRVLGEFEIVDAVKAHDIPIRPQGIATPVKPLQAKEAVGPVAIKTAESVVVTGIEQSASEKVMTWTPHEQVGSEPVPDIPGLAVIKRVSADEAMPGEKVEFVIQFRNMGNVPIRAVSVVDSLLPRLEYVQGSARGPKGTVFTANVNTAGSTELRWDLPGSIAPGDSGYVSFEAVVR